MNKSRIQSAHFAQSGFTLLELAIVLVITGFLLGGVMRGAEMVDQARIKDTINDFNGLSSAYLGYYDRYKALPGDDVNAGTRWSIFSARSGNGDGVVSGSYNERIPGDPATMPIDEATGESLNFWWHLRLSGFLAGPTGITEAAAPPTNAAGGMIGVQSAGAGLSGLIVCSSNLPGKIALGADTMLDDQRPNTGAVRGLKETAPNLPLSAAAVVNTYVENSTTRYVVCNAI